MIVEKEMKSLHSGIRVLFSLVVGNSLHICLTKLTKLMIFPDA